MELEHLVESNSYAQGKKVMMIKKDGPFGLVAQVL
jgi:hypothetical protein